jgi:hypothetical protein
VGIAQGIARPGAVRLTAAATVGADFSPDYLDSFGIDAVPGAAPREWARLSLRGANGPFGSVVWGGLLGFDLAGSDAPDSLVGWRINRDTADEFVLDVDGSLMAGRMIFSGADDQLVWTTMLRFHRPVGRRIWAIAGNAHRAIAPRCLDLARQALV